ncbi:MAG: DUF1049 domain-containing protein [Cyanobacteria bacterium P01_G01_bin.54]
MRTIANLLLTALLTAWLVFVATLSIQNITPISLKFFTFRSVEIPFGVLLTFAVGIGLGLGALAPLFVGQTAGQNGNRPRR